METIQLLNSMFHYTTDDVQGSDKILPGLIYIIIHSRINNLTSTCCIIETYRDPEAMKSM